jgi:hypothetical protein
MSGWYFVIFGVVGAVLWTVFESRKARKWQRTLAESREALTDDQFDEELQKLCVSNGTARFLLDDNRF